MASLEQRTAAAPKADERVKQVSFLTHMMRRPELGAVAGLVLVIVFFFLTADRTMFSLSGLMTIMAPASQLGILAIAAALLMIGGEFDLSIGSMVAFAGLIFGVILTNFGQPLSVAIVMTMLFAAFMGAINGQIVIHTRLPSFIVTLAFLFILRGLTLVGLKWATGGSTQLRGIGDRVKDSPLLGFFRRCAEGRLCLACGSRPDRQVPQRHAEGHGHPGIGIVVRGACPGCDLGPPAHSHGQLDLCRRW